MGRQGDSGFEKQNGVTEILDLWKYIFSKIIVSYHEEN
jgi:hypothetical protein